MPGQDVSHTLDAIVEGCYGQGAVPLPACCFATRCVPLLPGASRCDVPSVCPACLTVASYFWPDADDAAGRRMARWDAVMELRAMARAAR